MAHSRLAVFLDWNADPFTFLEQARTAQRFAQGFANPELLFAVDFTDSGLPAGRIHTIGDRQIAEAAAPLAAAISPRNLTRRAVVYEYDTRASMDLRYRRISAPAAPNDLGATTTWQIPRDGAIDLRDASLWLLPDGRSGPMLYPVRPTATTYHPLAELLAPAATALSGFARRMRYAETRVIACQQDDIADVRKRFGVNCEFRAWPAPVETHNSTPRADANQILFLSSSDHETAATRATIDREATRRNAEPIAATIVQLAGASPRGILRTLHRDTAAKRKGWIEKTNNAPVSAAKNALSKSHSIVILSDPAPLAFAIANWIERGHVVSFQTDLPPRAFGRWPNARVGRQGDLPGLVRLARTAWNRAP